MSKVPRILRVLAGLWRPLPGLHGRARNIVLLLILAGVVSLTVLDDARELILAHRLEAGSLVLAVLALLHAYSLQGKLDELAVVRFTETPKATAVFRPVLHVNPRQEPDTNLLDIILEFFLENSGGETAVKHPELRLEYRNSRLEKWRTLDVDNLELRFGLEHLDSPAYHVSVPTYPGFATRIEARSIRRGTVLWLARSHGLRDLVLNHQFSIWMQLEIVGQLKYCNRLPLPIDLSYLVDDADANLQGSNLA